MGGKGAIAPPLFQICKLGRLASHSVNLAHRHAVSLTCSYTLRKIYLIHIKTHKATIITVTSNARNKDQELVGCFLNIEYFIGY